MRTKRITFHVLLAGAIVCVTVSAQFALRARHEEERQAIAAEAKKLRMGELATQWNALRYSEVQPAQVSQAILLTNAGVRALPLSELQRAKLEARLGAVLRYLYQPSFDEYYRLKTENLRWEFMPSATTKNLLTNSSVAVGDSREVVRRVWRAVGGQVAGGGHARLTAICLDHITSEVTSSNSAGWILKGKVAKGLTVGRQAREPGFRYEFPPLEAGSAPGPVFFHLSFFARSSGSTHAGPVYLRLAWSEPSRD